MKTPVAFLIFNRPDTTEKVFEVIRQARPPKLLVVADGPRADRPNEAEKCAAARAIIDHVDWNCEVLKNYSDINLGCGKRLSTGITWLFEQVEEAIILEDDCLPNLSFFRFSEQMLERYREDERIMMISGTNFLGEWKSTTQSYHFSYYGGIWGWASWKRAWNYFDYEIKLWQQAEIRNRIRDVLGSDKQFKVREKVLWQAYTKNNNYDSWDYQWSFARLSQSGLSIVPSRNLVSNLGFDKNATHTTSISSEVAQLKTFNLELPLRFNNFMAVDREYDKRLFTRLFKRENLLVKLAKKLKEPFDYKNYILKKILEHENNISS